MGRWINFINVITPLAWELYVRAETGDSNVHGANMGPSWGRKDPGGPYLGPMNFAIWVLTHYTFSWWCDCSFNCFWNAIIFSILQCSARMCFHSVFLILIDLIYDLITIYVWNFDICVWCLRVFIESMYHNKPNRCINWLIWFPQ